MTPAMRTAMLQGKTYKQGGKVYKITGARNSNIPRENLMNKIKADIGVEPSKLRKRDVEINLDMLERRVKQLNEADAKLGTKYIDNTKEQTVKYQELQRAKISLQKQLDDLEDKLTKEIDEDPDYKILNDEYVEKQNVAADLEEQYIMEEYEGYYHAFYDDQEEGFKSLPKKKADKIKKANKDFEEVSVRREAFVNSYDEMIESKKKELIKDLIIQRNNMN